MGINDYKHAKEVLNNNDLMRLVCCFLHCDYKKIDFEAAAADFGSATPNAMRTMVYSALKKLKDADKGGDDDATGSSPTTPVKTKTTPKKRNTPGKQSGSRKKAKPRYEQQSDYDELPTENGGEGDEKPPKLELKEDDIDPFA